MKSCLLVDDSKVVRSFSKKILEEFSFSIDEAADGLEALNKCKVKMPDFILLDWNMPVMTGIEFLRELRKTQEGQKPVVIFCTTEAELSKITNALKEGANEYIMKPFDADILKSKLSQVGII